MGSPAFLRQSGRTWSHQHEAERALRALRAPLVLRAALRTTLRLAVVFDFTTVLRFTGVLRATPRFAVVLPATLRLAGDLRVALVPRELMRLALGMNQTSKKE